MASSKTGGVAAVGAKGAGTKGGAGAKGAGAKGAGGAAKGAKGANGKGNVGSGGASGNGNGGGKGAMSTGVLVIAPAVATDVALGGPGVDVKPAPYDPAEAKVLLGEYWPAMRALPADKLMLVRFDAHAAALAALAVHGFVVQLPGMVERIGALAAAGEIDPKVLDHLRALACIVVLLHAQAAAEGAFRTDVKVPPELVARGAEIEKRMQELCEYALKRDPEVVPLLDYLRPGTGHDDLAKDLLGYADIYERRAAIVAADPTNYRPTDAAEARKCGGEILAHLSAAMTPRAREAYDQLVRAATLLFQVYFEVQQAGLWLLRYDPRRDERFPSLYTAGRGPRVRKPAAPSPDAPPTPSAPTP